MGKASSKSVNAIYENIQELEEIGIYLNIKYSITELYPLRDTKEKAHIIDLYESFYYPRHSLRKLEEIRDKHYHLRKILRENIELYNKYNSTNINVEEYVKTTVKKLQPTLRVIGV